MIDYTFALVEIEGQDPVGNRVPGPVSGIRGDYSNALRASLSRYWSDASGGRVRVLWDRDYEAQIPLRVNGNLRWTQLRDKQRIPLARAAAGVPPGVQVIVISNVAGDPSSGKHSPGVGILLPAVGLNPSLAAHEMGHFFQRQGSGTGGHANVLRAFYRDEYADRACVMGSDSMSTERKFTFNDATLPTPVGAARPQRTGPGLCPAQADTCGWIDQGGGGAASIDPSGPASATLATWAGAPVEVGHRGAPVLAVVDGWAADDARLYLSVREPAGWDDGFWSVLGLGLAPGTPLPRVYLHMSAPDGDTALLGECPVLAGQSINAGVAPVQVLVTGVSEEGMSVTVAENPWRGWGTIDGVLCSPSARVAACTNGSEIDAFVVDSGGAVRRNRFDGNGWEAGPWPSLDGVEAEPRAGIAAVRSDDGTIRVFVVATDGTVRERRAINSDWRTAWVQVDGVTLDPTSSLAAAVVDGDGAVLAASLRDGMVLRTHLGADGRLASWHTAPGFPSDGRAALAATGDGDVRGRAYGIATRNADRSVWAWPDVIDPDERSWAPVSDLRTDPACEIAATVMGERLHAVVVGDEPLVCLLWPGTRWEQESPPLLDRDIGGGLTLVSRDSESMDLLAIDRRGRVRVTARSRRRDYTPPLQQYVDRRTVAFQVQSGHWITAKNGGGVGMGADAGRRQEWETFTMHGLGKYRGSGNAIDEIVALQTGNGHFVGAVGGGGSHAVAEADVIGPWEKFVLRTVQPGRVTLRCIDGVNFLVANGGGGDALAADAVAGPSTEVGGGAVFQLNVY